MSLDAIFKAYDIRGVYPDEIDDALARRIGNAFAHFTGAQQVIVGHDMRPSSEPLTAAFIEGATLAGADVTDIGLCSTDVVYFAAGKLDAPGAMFTASHNPAQYNGIKLCRAGAAPIGQDTGLGQIKAAVEAGLLERAEETGRPLVGGAPPDLQIVGGRRRLEQALGNLVDNALRYPWTFTSGVYEAACVWIPPGGTELSKEGEAELEPLVSELSGGDPGPVLALCEALEAAHPRVAPHFYLSLLGTHPQSRGRGLGMAMVREVLERIDAEHMPAYLESSLPDNDRRYASVGFVRTGEVNVPGSPTATTMWRAAR